TGTRSRTGTRARARAGTRSRGAGRRVGRVGSRRSETPSVAHARPTLAPRPDARHHGGRTHGRARPLGATGPARAGSSTGRAADRRTVTGGGATGRSDPSRAPGPEDAPRVARRQR